MHAMSNDVGTLYVLANRDHSLAKVGMTRNGRPETRADDYGRQHGIQWRVYWSVVTCHVADAEASAHRALQDRRFSLLPEAREVFHCTPMLAKRIAERYVTAPAGASASFSAARKLDPSLARNPLWSVCREAIIAAASIGLTRAFGGPGRSPVRSASLRLLSRWLRDGR
jgi:hypothetical protein